MEQVIHPQAKLTAGAAKIDITPPVGMYHRMWGAAIHDRSTGVHRPLVATALWLAPAGASASGGSVGEALLLIALDHCILERTEADLTRARERLGFAPRVDLAEGVRRTVAWARAAAGEGGEAGP